MGQFRRDPLQGQSPIRVEDRYQECLGRTGERSIGRRIREKPGRDCGLWRRLTSVGPPSLLVWQDAPVPMAGSLRHHDWQYRWESLLQSLLSGLYMPKRSAPPPKGTKINLSNTMDWIIVRQDQYKNPFKNTFDSYRITGRVLNKEAKCKDPALRCCE